MKKVCAWCKKVIDTASSSDQTKDNITHGICGRCADKLFAQMGVDLERFLNRLVAPVLVVDSTGTVKTANATARSFLNKDLPDIEGFKGGDVFTCAYAKLPGGCGNTIHCSGCTIRNTVMDTYHTGKSNLRAPACLNRGTPDDCQQIDFLISTEKVGDVVLLRIDKVGNDELDPSANPASLASKP